ncbi:MAG: ATP-binding cassette domain-containing protein, partial [Acidimicrobiia bacterium]|nr:ATP-binding cassette domain-containing protein [Acidimicrobiia bacterium]
DISKQSIETPLFLAVILVALLLQKRSESRVDAADEGSWSAAGTLHPIPAFMRNLPEVQFARILGGVLLAVLALALPAILQPGRLDQVSIGLVFGLGALSLVVLSGWAGTISLGQFALIGVGAVVAGDLMVHLNLDFFLSAVAAGAAGAVAAVILGSPALRVRGIYLAVTTLAFAVAANNFFFNPVDFGKELPAANSVVRPVLWKRFPLHGEGALYFLCLGLLVLTIVLTRGIRQGRPGRVILATRDNSRAAEAMAVPTARTKLIAFMISGVVAGVAGALYVSIIGGVGFQTFQPVDSITVFSMVVIGGMSSIGGSLAGVALIQLIGIEFPKAQILLTGVGLLVVLMVFPAGLAGLYERVRDRFLVRVARRRGLDTSVWADAGSAAAAAEAAEPAEPAEDAETAPVVPVSVDGGDNGQAALLRCQGVNAAYGQLQVLFGVDLTVREGEIVALLGTNGAGKSSLLRSVTGLLPASAGTVTFDGRDVTSAATESIAGMGLTMMPGGRGVFPSLTVAENLRVASWPLRRDRAAAEEARSRSIALFPILGERANQLAGNLSGGEQQMLSLAMAFLVKPKLLCIDELSLGLAPTVVSTLLDAVRDIHRAGTTILIVEQSVNVALLLAERATFLEKGQVRFTGPAAGLLDRPDLLRAVFIGSHDGKTELPGVGTVPARPSSRTAKGSPAIERDGVPALECTGLVKRFGGIRAVDDVDLKVMPHEVVGLIGHNGAGKTTLFDVVSGFLTPDGGRIRVFGEDVTEYPPHRRARTGLGRSCQEARLYPSLTVVETISVALERHLASREPFAAAFRMPAATDSEAAVA